MRPEAPPDEFELALLNESQDLILRLLTCSDPDTELLGLTVLATPDRVVSAARNGLRRLRQAGGDRREVAFFAIRGAAAEIKMDQTIWPDAVGIGREFHLSEVARVLAETVVVRALANAAVLEPWGI